jgi:primosomal protein N'
VTIQRRPAGASVPTDAAEPAGPAPVTGAADVLPDGVGKLGCLSYLVPDGMVVRPGDAVQVPLGKRTVYGMIVGAGDAAVATRPIEEVFGKRADPGDISLARAIAKFHFSGEAAVLPRLAPKTGRGHAPLEDWDVELAGDLPLRPRVNGPAGTETAQRRLLVRAPLVRSAVLAAYEAARLAGNGGQVLVLCPSGDVVEEVTACFSAGAQRLDAKAARGAWKGFGLGTVRIGIGTRAAALFSAPKLAGIVVVDERSQGHVEVTEPHTHARDVANARSRALGIALTLISDCPTAQALGAGVAVLTAGSKQDWPRMKLIDRTEVASSSRWTPPALLIALRRAQRAGQEPVVVVQRKSALRRCGRCHEPRPCPLCESSLCRHPEPTACPRCSSTEGTWMSGWDAARVADRLGLDVRIVTLAELSEVRDAGLVVLFDVDAALSIAELIPDTLAGRLVMQAAAAAGHGGTLLALTDDPSAPLLVDLFGNQDVLSVARRTSASAKSAALPPFGRLVSIKVSRQTEPKIVGWPGQVHGPRRVNGAWELLVRIPADRLLELRPHLDKLRRPGHVKVTVS